MGAQEAMEKWSSHDILALSQLLVTILIALVQLAWHLIFVHSMGN